MTNSTNQTVLVTGATGFIGKEVVKQLLAHGWQVRAMSRNASAPGLPAHECLCVVRGDMRDAASLAAVMPGVTAVVHLAAAKSDEPDSDDVNIAGAQRLVAACQGAGCRRLINISTQSAKIQRKGTYAHTKNAADDVFHRSGLAVTTLHPSVVYGEERSGVFGTILGFVQKLPVVPVLGNGRWISAPIYVGDVAKAIIACIEQPITIGRIYDLGGPDQISLDHLICRICAGLGIRRRIVHVPFSIALLAARMLAALISKPPITVSNVLGSNQDTDIDIEPARRDFGFAPIPLADGLKLVLRAILAAPAGICDAEHAQDFKLMTRYLLDTAPAEVLIARYVAAHRMLLGNAVATEWAFVRRHPRWLPFVDAAAGLLARDSVVRKKLLLATAILEATPEHAAVFLEQPGSRAGLFAGMAWQGFRAGFKTIVGLPLLFAARRGGWIP